MRTDSYSALDFMYWVLEGVEENYPPTGTNDVFLASQEDTIMHESIVEAALVCGVETPRQYSALMAKVERHKTVITPQEATGTRGAIVHRGGVLHVCVGDGKRMVGANIEGSISLYELSASDREPEYWDGAFKVPELRYL